MRRAAGELFVHGDPTVIEIEIQRELDFLSREGGRSATDPDSDSESKRFGGLVGLDAVAGCIVDMFLGYEDNILRDLIIPFCDTRVVACGSWCW
jgi:hypothetical protein